MCPTVQLGPEVHNEPDLLENPVSDVSGREGCNTRFSDPNGAWSVWRVSTMHLIDTGTDLVGVLQDN